MLQCDARRVRRRCRPELGPPVRARRRSRRPVLVGRCHGKLGEPHRPGGSRGLDDYFTRDFTRNIGAEIMGRNKFGPHAARGRTTTGRAGGATHHRSARRCSCSRTTSARRSPWLTPPSTSSTPHPPTPCDRRSTPQRQRRAPRWWRHNHPRVPRRRPRRHDAHRRRADRAWPRRTPVELPHELLDRFHLDSVPSPSGVTHLLFLAPVTAAQNHQHTRTNALSVVAARRGNEHDNEAMPCSDPPGRQDDGVEAPSERAMPDLAEGG